MALIRGLIPTIVALSILTSACFTADPPWMNAQGEVVSATVVLEYRGFRRCGTQQVTFLQFLGRQYANDPQGALGALFSVDGSRRALKFEVLLEPPSGAAPTGFTRGEREVYLDADVDDYLYIVRPSTVERWPRAEVYCEGQYRPPGR